ncbi:TPA: BlaI/MecI/CopY family transcriptional regulator [Clostridioides difficile]|uniref:BlaI/MecI/CopY family transcriptional regulator n=1 Tax=Clostridioides difficile TaxID=1496 RepID=UPI00038C7971|nr:BlaI/MecI/CopY family transcriptional regulator [Clostridioides difficile]OFU10181.1 BlaI/MecI/CopY family transcriptional regulator [Clostridium sp. HMSC19C11]EGT3655284.1 BlaI/MecI/CopY family transcriptional regulator [Clostridioides difficile]EGT3663406.1 BlaI/MecI/CopY family transcriptional regulator [Clostridioides difficile]EGT3689299.1 BlaI/MecI/CopY family transcriptional regulator [Clostridioides difficile]EGT3696775.1 BlaI/MecI/CopY family transcriptional regulator [Clostridioid
MKEEILIEKLLRAELIVMEYLWKKDTLMPKKEIVKEIKQIYGWHKSTIKILLKRLVDKRYLARYIINFQSYYKIIIDSKEYYTFKKKVLKSSKSIKIMHSLTTIHKNVSKEKLDLLDEYYRNLKE